MTGLSPEMQMQCHRVSQKACDTIFGLLMERWKMPDVKTNILPLTDIIHRLDCFINQDDVGTIFPENFFTSIKYHLMQYADRDEPIEGPDR